MQTKNDLDPKPGTENEPKLIPTDTFGEAQAGGDEERPPDVVVEN